MDAHTTNSFKEDFQAWSGGFPPDSEQQIFIYMEYAYGTEADADEVREMLRKWMQEDQIDHPNI